MTLRLKQTWAGLVQRGFAHAAFLWTAAALIYGATTARDVLPADSGEFQLIAAGWGIGHPPGYPLYTVATALWTRLFALGRLPFRANVFSAVLAATTLVLVAGAVARWARSVGATPRRARLGAGLAALALGSSTTFWAQATTANIRMPTMLFVAWGYLALVGLGTPSADDALLSLGLATGLGVGHHPSLAFVAVGWALYVILREPKLLLQPRRWWRAALVATLAWLLPQLYLPLRGSMPNVPLNPGLLTTWQGFWQHVLARGFGGDMLAFATRQDLALRLPLLPTLFRMQFPTVVLGAMALAWGLLLWRDTRMAASLALSWALQTFITITYRAPQTVEYLMPAYVPMALALGMAFALPNRSTSSSSAVETTRRVVSRGVVSRWAVSRSNTTTLAIALILILAVRLPGRVRDLAELAADTSIRDRVAPLLAVAGPEATILADWHWAPPLWVLQAVEGHGTGVTVDYVYPEAGRDYEAVWRARAEAARDAEQTLLSTHRYDWQDWTFAPVGGGYRLYPRPLTALPADLDFTLLDTTLGPVRLLGLRWSGEAEPGATLELQLAWQPVDDDTSPPSLTTRVWTADQSALLSAADRTLDPSVMAGEVRFTTFTHQLPIDRCTESLAVTVGSYRVTDSGFEDLGTLAPAPLHATCNYPRLPVERLWPGVALGGPWLRGVDYDTHGEGQATAYLHWCGPGKALHIRIGDADATVGPLALGQCRTVQLPVADTSDWSLQRPDGRNVVFVGPNLPVPHPAERYLPFGREMVLVGSDLTAGPPGVGTLLTLHWRTLMPQPTDYAVSVRAEDESGAWLGVHDMQPGLGAIPTLKWVSRGDLIRDPHPLGQLQQAPSWISIAVYERFRITPLRSPFGDVARYQLP